MTEEQRASLALGIIPVGSRVTYNTHEFIFERGHWITYHEFKMKDGEVQRWPYMAGSDDFITELFLKGIREKHDR